MPRKFGSRDLKWIKLARASGTEPTEYFCHGCKQLILNGIDEDLTKCRECGSSSIIEGAIGELDKKALKEEFANAT